MPGEGPALHDFPGRRQVVDGAASPAMTMRHYTSDTAIMSFRTLDGVDVAGKRVLLRADLNVPVRDGKITDLTRIERLSPTIRELAGKGARVIVCSHFDRPKGKRVPEMSLAPVAAALGQVLGQRVALRRGLHRPRRAAGGGAHGDGDVLVLENTRFHAGEEKNDPAFAAELAKLGDLYVNDAFSAAHRAHASTEGVAHLLPAYAGRLMQAELEALHAALGNPQRPVMAIVGGAKVSTKLDLLGNLVDQVNVLVIGGAMANTFLAAAGRRGRQVVAGGGDARHRARHPGGRQDRRLRDPAADRCRGRARASSRTRRPQTVPIDAVPADAMILDVGPATVAALIGHIAALQTLVWNGPLGAFETPPFDAGNDGGRPGGRRGDAGRHAAQRRRRRRHGLGAAPRRACSTR